MIDNNGSLIDIGQNTDVADYFAFFRDNPDVILAEFAIISWVLSIIYVGYIYIRHFIKNINEKNQNIKLHRWIHINFMTYFLLGYISILVGLYHYQGFEEFFILIISKQLGYGLAFASYANWLMAKHLFEELNFIDGKPDWKTSKYT